MSAQGGGTPWWYSGDEADDGHDAASGAASEGSGEGSRDWTTLVLGAQRIVDWATEKVMAPHAEHDDPREHPDCVVCRTMTVLGDVGLRSAQGSDGTTMADAQGDIVDAESGEPVLDARVIHWIPIRGEASAP